MPAFAALVGGCMEIGAVDEERDLVRGYHSGTNLTLDLRGNGMIVTQQRVLPPEPDFPATIALDQSLQQLAAIGFCHPAVCHAAIIRDARISNRIA